MSTRISDYLGIEETARLFGTSPVALYTQRARGQNPGALGVRIGRRVIFRRDAIDEWYEREMREQLAAVRG